MAERRSRWQKLPGELRRSLLASWSNGVPPEATVLHARWWQFEAWLRDLVHVELRSRLGVTWSSALSDRSARRARQDDKNAYMASPDAQYVLAYMDVFDLFQVINENYELFEPVLMDYDRWNGRIDELRDIRHRVAHCRRPHDDDLARVEQLLRDLERGAFVAVASYNRRNTPLPDLSDPLVKAWIGRSHEAAFRLVDHAREQYDTFFRLTYSQRPWAGPRQREEPVSGQAGYLWHASFLMRDRHLEHPNDVWGDTMLDVASTRELLVHLAIDSPYQVEATFAAVDDAGSIADAIGHCFDVVLMASRPGVGEPGSIRRADREYEVWGQLAANLDPRVQVHTAWTTLDETTVPVTIFGTGRAITPGEIRLA